ncbi:MAG TPA: thioredoxin [Microthrixaceae bacterium]|jgi:thioredoxin 1|nr:thioredoxin [Microthrixaceae bacterium]HNI34584.1 thioredoxin [Microthrixaceae bacterium]
MATGISNLTESTFSEEVAGSDVPVLVDFWAEWCNPCKLVAPILEEINGENDGKLKVAKVDVDSNPALARRFDVMSIPTMILFKDGEPTHRIVGAKGKAQLVEELSPYL